MKMFKTLIKTRLLALWYTMFARSSSKKLSKGKKILIGIAAVYVISQLVLSIGMLFASLADGLLPIGMEQLYFCVAAILGFSLCFIGSVFMAHSLIFDARDTELLVSMPIPPRHIVASRFLPLFVIDYLYSCAILLPSIVVYFSRSGFDALKLVLFIAVLLLLPFFSAALTCVFGWLTALFSSHTSGKVLIQTVTTLVLLGGYMIINFNLQNYLTKLINNGSSVLAAIEKALPPFYWFGLSIANGDGMALIKYALCCLVPFALVYVLISKSFVKLSLSGKARAKKEYVQHDMKTSAVRTALIHKELRRFFSMPNYMINCGIGAVFALMLAGALLIKGGNFIQNIIPITQGAEYIPAIYCAIICFCIIMCNQASASISLEGTSFAIIKSMPLRAMDIFASKVLTNLLISIPCGLIAVFAGWYAFDVSIFFKLGMLALCLSIAIFGASFGITLNAHFPKFDWLNATVVIKQSMSPTIYVFGGMGAVILPGVLYGLLLKNYLDVSTYLFILAGVFLLASTGMLRHLRTRGEEIYRDMG